MAFSQGIGWGIGKAIRSSRAISEAAFVFTVQTDNAGTSAANQFTIPITSATPYNISTSDGQSITGATGATTLTFPSAGTYTVSITDSCEGWQFNNGGDKLKLLNISNWGVFKNTAVYSFYGAQNLTCSAVDAPINAHTTMRWAFIGCSNFNGAIGNWDVSNVTDFESCFHSNYVFNQPLNDWDVSSATTFLNLFWRATLFNQPLNNWDTSSVTSMNNMFSHPFFTKGQFNQDISLWDVSNVTNFAAMFNNTNFNQDLSSWNVSSLTVIGGMFAATPFNYPLNNWVTSSVTSLEGVFAGAPSFNQDLSSWDVSNVTNLRNLFAGATSFNQDISGWNVSSVTNLERTFNNAGAFSYDISGWSMPNLNRLTGAFGSIPWNPNISGWDVSNVLYMDALFYGNSANITDDFSGWNTSNVVTLESFGQASNFNGDISAWDVSSVTNLRSFMYGNVTFSGTLSSWDTSSVTTMIFNPFYQTFAYDDDLGGWDVSNVSVIGSIFKNGIPFSTANYDSLLVGWEASLQAAYPGGVGYPHTIGVSFPGSKYTLGSSAETARASLVNTYGWTITDGGGIAARNTRIGGLSAVLNTSANIASALGLTEPDITNVLVDNNDVLFDVGTTYTLPGNFKSNTTITAFDDRQGNVIGLTNQAFRYCSAINYLNFPSLTVLPLFTFEGLTNLVSADFISCTDVGGGGNFLANSTATITVALSALTSNADGGPHQSLRALNCTVDYDGYVDEGTWNTQVDGIAATENTRLLLGNRLGCKTAALLNFQIVGNDVRAKVYGNYSISGGAFQSRTDITDFKDNDNKVININLNAFAYTTNYLNATFNGITSLVANNQFRNSAIDTIRMNALTTISGNYLARNTALSELFFPALINWNTNALFYENGNITNIEAPSLQTLGTTTGYDTAIGSALAFGGTVTVSDFLQTSNAGQPDGDLTWLIANRSANVVYTGQSYTNQLVASYNFDADFTDYTGNHPLTSSGNVTAGTAGGVVSNCSDFGGTSSDFLEALDSDDFSFTDGVSDLPFSVSMWLNFDVVANSWFFDKRGTSPNDEYQITYYLGRFAIALGSQGGFAAYLNATYAITPVVGTWYHLTWTYDGSGTFAGIKLYIDGVSQALTNISVGTYVGMSNGTAVPRFGKFTDSSPFNGKMDETHIWKNRELTAAEVTDIYTTELAGNSILP